MGVFDLPDGYTQIKCIDLQKNKKLAIKINLAVLAVIILFVAGIAVVPMNIRAESLNQVPLPFFIQLLFLVACICAQLLVRGVLIKKFSGKWAKYGTQGSFAFAGSDAYFDKHRYLTIALLPAMVLGTLILLLHLFLPVEWFWRIYFLHAANLAMVVADTYIAAVLRGLPSDTLVHDAGVVITFFSRDQRARPPANLQ